MSSIFFHVGYGKTATTWLQQFIFPKVKGLNYLGKSEALFPDWLLQLNYLDDSAFNQRLECLSSHINSLRQGCHTSLASSEAFTNFSCTYSQATRLSRIQPDAKIIISLRHPVKWLVSNYIYCIQHEGFYMPLQAYIDYGTKRTPLALEKRAPFYLPDLFFNEVVNHYRYLFGSSNVLVLLYEELIDRPNYYADQLSNFTNLDFNIIHDFLSSRPLSSDSFDPLPKRSENLVSHLRSIGVQPLPSLPNEILCPPLIDPELLNELASYLLPHCSEFYNS